MKSIKEKAEAYGEAIINGSRLWESGEITRENYEYIFPELKESEDERIRKALIRFHKSTIDIDGIKGADVIAWLEKQGEQKPWSEEDEDILNTIINHFEIDLECTENDDIIRWLKSLRPQNKWKPSDEQLDALQYVCRNLNPPPYDKIGWNSIKTLELMCQDLKKLKE